MTIKGNNLSRTYCKQLSSHSGERGIALITAIMMMLLLSAIALTVLAVVRTESHIAGADLKRTQTFYCAASAIEKMTSDFGALYARTSRPTQAQLDTIAALYPSELVAEGFDFTNPKQTIIPDDPTLTTMRATQGISAPSYPRVTMPANSPFGGLIASVSPFILTSTCTYRDGTQVALTRNMNNYLIPLFQFGMFSDEDIELHPGPAFTFNGRVHANGNIYVNGDVTFLDKVTTANEFIYDVLRNGSTRSGATVSFQVDTINVMVSKGSMINGPNITTATATPPGQRGYFPGSPDGTINTTWNATSVAPAAINTPNKFGGQLLTRTTGAAPLKLPLQLDNNPTRELIKRRMPNDSPDPLNPTALTSSRYHTKAEIRILIDDEDPKTPAGVSATDASGIPTTKGVLLSTFDPIPLPKGVTVLSPAANTNGAGRALWRVNDLNTTLATSYNETISSFVRQEQNGTAGPGLVQATTVRGVKAGPTAADFAAAQKNITGATNASPIVVTSVAHGYSNGDKVFISGVGGNTAANGVWIISNVAANTFRLVGSTGNGTYTASTGKVYAVKALAAGLPTALGAYIPPGAGLSGRIWIQVVDSTGAVRDVTEEILSLGMTEGEPNAIVTLQRPLWTAFTQGSRDADNTSNGTTDDPYTGDTAHTDSLVGPTGIFNTTHMGAIGEIDTSTARDPNPQATYGYLTGIKGPASAGQATRSDIATYIALNPSDWAGTNWSLGRQWNAIVPINLYNVREGHLKSSVTQNAVYERGITNVVEINMRNLARWMDGVYDQNLLAGTNALSANIAKPDGYVVYVSDRRGDKVKSLVDSSGATINSTNGMVDNVDIYGLNGVMDAGEDVQARGTTVGSTLGGPTTSPFLKDTTELPDPLDLFGSAPSTLDERMKRAITVAKWSNPSNYFRRSVRLFNADNLRVTGAVDKLSTTLGITMSSENMVYIWGNYNTAGINAAPPDGTSSLNESTSPYHYCPGVGPLLSTACASLGPDTEVPSSIVADAIFPLSRTWFDSVTALFPDDYKDRPADRNTTAQQETSVRAGIIAGNNLSALDGTPDCDNGNDSRLSGGMHNFPRFLEDWLPGNKRWNFTGSFIPLYHSTQALGQWWYVTGGKSIYGAPIRNWSFDMTFTDPAKLPPGTPQFQHVEPTGFRQIL
jgi:hypothetical protein